MTHEDDSRPATTPPEGYDVLAERADEIDPKWGPWGDNPFQEHYSWPATSSLLPDLAGRRVLDAGCGIGDHVEWLLERGASVVGIDASENAVETARERIGERARFHRADLTEPLDCLADDSVDVVLSHLVLDHVEDLRPTFAEFHRVLDSDRTLVFTTVHPIQTYCKHDVVERYYRTQAVEIAWPGATFPSYHRSVSDLLGSLIDAGFRIEAFEEPEPRPEYERHFPGRYETALERPAVCCVRASASPDGT